MELLTAREAAARLGVHDSRVRRLCRAGRLPGARHYGNMWLIPDLSVAGFRPLPNGRPPRARYQRIRHRRPREVAVSP